MGFESCPKVIATVYFLKRKLEQLRDFKEIDYDEIFFDLVSMNILSLKEIDFFWDMPSHLLMDFYQKMKLKYYQSINEQNIAVAKMNTNLMLFFSSFGGKDSKKVDQEAIFKQSLPFNPNVLELKERENTEVLSAETIDILRYYYSHKLIPERVLKGIEDDQEIKEAFITAIRRGQSC